MRGRTNLKHELGDHAVEGAGLVVKGLALSADTLLTCKQPTTVRSAAGEAVLSSLATFHYAGL